MPLGTAAQAQGPSCLTFPSRDDEMKQGPHVTFDLLRKSGLCPGLGLLLMLLGEARRGPLLLMGTRKMS